MTVLVEQADEGSYYGVIRALVFEGDLSTARLEAVLASTSAPEWGRIVSDYSEHNLVTNAGRQQMTKLIVGESTVFANYVGLSTSAAPLLLTDTALTNELYRGVVTIRQSINTTSQRYVALFTSGSFASTGLLAAGLFTAATTGGTMFAEGSIAVAKSTTQALVYEHRIAATT